MHKEKRILGPLWLKRYQRRRQVGGSFLSYQFRKLLDRGGVQQRANRQLPAENFLYTRHQPNRQKRVSSKIEKIVPNPNSPLPQNLLPYPHQLALNKILGR